MVSYKEKVGKILPVFIILVLLSSFSSAWILDTHDYINTNALEESKDTPIKQVIENNYEDFVACNYLTDFSVFYYFENGFSAIGKKYKQTHSQSVCTQMVEDASNEEQLACAYGVCAHEVQDTVSHSKYVPLMIQSTNVPNSIIHILAEEKANNLVKSSDRTAYTRKALADNADQHKDFWRDHVVKNNPNFPFDSMYDAFTSEVTQNDKYTAGFRSFFAIPTDVLITLVGTLGSMVFGTIYLYKRKNKTTINKVTMFASGSISVLMVLIFVLFYMGTLWIAFQAVAVPITKIMPNANMEFYISESIDETVNFINLGPSYVLSVTDPTGEQNLLQANNNTSETRFIFNLVLGIAVVLIIWLNTRKKR